VFSGFITAGACDLTHQLSWFLVLRDHRRGCGKAFRRLAITVDWPRSITHAVFVVTEINCLQFARVLPRLESMSSSVSILFSAEAILSEGAFPNRCRTVRPLIAAESRQSARDFMPVRFRPDSPVGFLGDPVLTHFRGIDNAALA